jgi:hypothetical protein
MTKLDYQFEIFKYKVKQREQILVEHIHTPINKVKLPESTKCCVLLTWNPSVLIYVINPVASSEERLIPS